jgi:DNA-binding winged helix-turn-helix (wHTH) protein/TolB-like protein
MTYIFGVFAFDSASLELRKSGRVVALEPQPARALSLLVERAGEIVTREELAARVWGAGTHVDFNRGLAYCIGQIRTALGDSGENSRFVQTVPKRGFKFVAPVGTATETPADAVAMPRPTTTLRRLSAYPLALVMALCAVTALLAVLLVAVLVERGAPRPRPVVAVSIFDNETGDSRYDRPLHAMSDAVVDRLTGLGPAKVGVVGNASILRMPRNGRDLERIEAETGASHVILAQLQPSKGDLTLLMHLIRLDDGTHLWTRRIARPGNDSLDGLDAEAATMIEAGVRAHVLTPQ